MSDASDLEELRAVFDRRWEADMRAIKMWQAANPGNDLVWPDHADLVVWLLGELDVARRLVRVDSALAGQLSRSMTENARLKIRLAELEKGNP